MAMLDEYARWNDALIQRALMAATGKYPKKVDWKAVDAPEIADWLGDLAKDRDEAVAATLPPPPVDPEEERWQAAVAETRSAAARAFDVSEEILGPSRSEHVTYDPPMPAGLREKFEPMGVRPADGPTAPAHGTMKAKAREKETTVKIETMTRRSAVTGAHGIYAEGRVFDARGALKETRRAFLAAEFLGTSTIASTAKGARWEIVAYESGAEEAQAAFRAYLDVADGTIDPLAIICELTAGDIDRIRRGVMPSLIYPAAGLLEAAIDAFKDEVD